MPVGLSGLAVVQGFLMYGCAYIQSLVCYRMVVCIQLLYLISKYCCGYFSISYLVRFRYQGM